MKSNLQIYLRNNPELSRCILLAYCEIAIKNYKGLLNEYYLVFAVINNSGSINSTKFLTVATTVNIKKDRK